MGMNDSCNKLLALLDEYHRLSIAEQIDYQKFYLYSLITHSTAIEGSTVTKIENQLLFNEGISTLTTNRNNATNKPNPKNGTIIQPCKGSNGRTDDEP